MAKRIEISEETYNALKDQILAEENKSKEKKFEIKSISGSVLYTSSKTTIKEALEEAVQGGANLRRSDLSEADLRGADLSEADLSGANLRRSDLRGADLSEADLSGANLSGAVLSEAVLSGADLSGADLMNCKFYGRGGKSKIKRKDVDTFLKALGFAVEDETIEGHK